MGLEIKPAGVSWPLKAPDGTVSAPSYSFTNDTDCGLYRNGANNIHLSMNGAYVQDISQGSIGYHQNLEIKQKNYAVGTDLDSYDLNLIYKSSNSNRTWTIYAKNSDQTLSFENSNGGGEVLTITEAGKIRATNGGIRTKLSTANTSNPPSDGELDTAFGTPATVGSGFTALLDDNGADTNVYLVMSNGTSWWYTALTKAV